MHSLPRPHVRELTIHIQGLEGTVRLSGQTPGIGKYKIRMENRMFGPPPPLIASSATDAYDTSQTRRTSTSRLVRTAKTLATSSSERNSWGWASRTASSGKPRVRSFSFALAKTRLTRDRTDALMNTMLAHSKEVLEPYGQESPPDPALLFSFPNEVRTNAGLYGLQRTYVGRWGVDIFFDANDAPANLDRQSYLQPMSLDRS